MMLAGVLVTAHSSDLSLLSPSAVHYPTTSFNAFIATVVPPLWNTLSPVLRKFLPILRTHQILTSCYLSFTPNLGLKHCPSTNPAYPDSSPSYPFQLQTPSSTDNLPDSLDHDPLPIDHVGRGFCFGYALVNKLVPAHVFVFVGAKKSRVYDSD